MALATNHKTFELINYFRSKQYIVCSQTSCAVLSHCFTDRRYARESTFCIQKLVALATNHKTFELINYQFNRDLHNPLLMRGHDFTWITELENRNAHDVSE